MTRLREDLALITAKTLEHYNERAADFWEGTRDHDVKQNIEALLRHIRGAPPLRILDFGCGPGRDLAAFRSLGHEPIGLEGSPPLAAMAREQSVLQRVRRLRTLRRVLLPSLQERKLAATAWAAYSSGHSFLPFRRVHRKTWSVPEA